jgi:hypothetical protein
MEGSIFYETRYLSMPNVFLYGTPTGRPGVHIPGKVPTVYGRQHGKDRRGFIQPGI